jgi:hypothetical protein
VPRLPRLPLRRKLDRNFDVDLIKLNSRGKQLTGQGEYVCDRCGDRFVHKRIVRRRQYTKHTAHGAKDFQKCEMFILNYIFLNI